MTVEGVSEHSYNFVEPVEVRGLTAEGFTKGVLTGEAEWVHVEYEVRFGDGDSTYSFWAGSEFVGFVEDCEAFHGIKRDHIFDGFKHKDGYYYGQFVMWNEADVVLQTSPDPIRTLAPVTATHVRFRVYKGGLPA